MLTVSEAIAQRRSVRSFSNRPVPGEYIEQMLEAARLAPSATNRQPWRFIVATDPADRKALRRFGYGQDFIEEAPVVFVCCVDLMAYSPLSGRKRMQQFADTGTLQTHFGMFPAPQYHTSPLNESERHEIQGYIAAANANLFIAVEHMALTAAALGLGTCWIGALDSEAIWRYYHLGPTIIVTILLPTGFPTEAPGPRQRLSRQDILLKPYE